jgi:hypothetical protein
MGRAGVTRDQVFEAADALAGEGVQPTVKTVRDRIGGSYSTITPLLAEWKAVHAGRGVAEIPDAPDAVTAAMRQVWVAAWKMAQETIQTEREGLAAARREMEKERTEMTQEIKELEERLGAAEGERDKLAASLGEEQARRQEAVEEVATHRVERARLEERVTNTTKRADELNEQVVRLEGRLAELAKEEREKTR